MNFRINSLDIPFGLVFKQGTFESSGRAIFFGLFYSLTQDDKVLQEPRKKYNDWYSKYLKGNNFLGLFFHFENYFRINESFFSGFFLSIKFSLGSVIESITETKPLRTSKSSDLKKTSSYRTTHEMGPLGSDIIFGIVARF